MMTFGPFQVLLPAMRRCRRDLALALCAAAAAQLIGIALPLLARKMLNHAIAHHHNAKALSSSALDTRAIWIITGMLAGLAVLRGVLRWHQGMRGERAAQRVLADVRGRMYRHLQRLSQGYFDRRPAGKVLVRFVGDANSLRAWLARTLISVPADVLMIIGVIIAIATIRLELVVAAVAPLVPLIPALIWINPRARLLTREGRRNQTHLCALLNEHLSAMGVIKATNTQQIEAGRADEIIDRVAAANIRRGRLDAWSQGLSATLATGVMTGVVLWGVILYRDGTLNHGDLLAAIWLTLLVRSPVNRLTRANVVHQRARVAVERIAALLDREPERGWSESLPRLRDFGQRIRFRNVGYRDINKRWAIRRLSATVSGPALVAVTEDNGRAGSLLLELLLRLRRPHKGRIYVDGQDIRRLYVADLRQNIGWVDRQRHVANVTATVWQTPSERQALLRWWEQTAEIAPAAPDVMPAPAARWDGRFGHDVLLRVALCCALRPDPPILLIDDPTAGVGPAARKRVIDWLLAASRDKLLVVVTKDSHLLSAASEVIRLQRSKAAKRGRDRTADGLEREAHGPPRPPVLERADAAQPGIAD